MIKVLTDQEKNPRVAFDYSMEYVKETGTSMSEIDRIIEYRCFLGIISIKESQAEYDNMMAMSSVGEYIVFFGRYKPGKFVFLEHLDQGRMWFTYYTTFEECYTRMYIQGLGKQFDRGKSRIYAKAAKRQTSNAISSWLMVGRRLGVVRDIRRVIGSMLWEHRHLWVQ